MKEHETLQVLSLTKFYGKRRVVNEVTFSMRRGEIVGLLGPNGAGKTTCFYMIAGFVKPTEGRIYLGKEEISLLPMYKRALGGIAYLPQEPSSFRKLSVENNVKAIIETRADLTKQEKHHKLEFLLEEFGIASRRHQKAHTLSGGERRRTEIARSLARDPQFLLLDEPFSGIDPIAVQEIRSIVQRLSTNNIGILITDHNVRDTLSITDRACILSQGEILVSGTKEKLIANKTARTVYLGEDFSM